MLRLDFALNMAEIERQLVAYLHQRERTQHQGRVDAQDLAEEQSRSIAIAQEVTQGVVELDGHVAENVAAPPEVASCEGMEDSSALGRDMEERGRPRHVNVRCHSAANRPEKPADRLQMKPAAGVEILLTLGQRGDELALRHGKVGPMAALAIEDFVELEFLQHASQLGDGVVGCRSTRTSMSGWSGSETTQIAAERSGRCPSLPTWPPASRPPSSAASSRNSSSSSGFATKPVTMPSITCGPASTLPKATKPSPT